MATVRCNKCLWAGEEHELPRVLEADGTGESHACPVCRTDNYLMDLAPPAKGK